MIVPKIQFSLRAIHALGLHNEDLSTLDKVTAKCDEYSKPLQYLPGGYILTVVEEERLPKTLACLLRETEFFSNFDL